MEPSALGPGASLFSTRPMAPTLTDLANRHLDRTLVVVGTGPSAWNFGQKPEVQALLRRTINIGVNRAFSLGFPIQYQVSLDKIWNCILTDREDRKQLADFRKRFTQFQAKYKRGVKGWTLEDYVAAFRKQLKPRPEVWRWFLIRSPHAPFVRFVKDRNCGGAPYDHVCFPVIDFWSKDAENLRRGDPKGLIGGSSAFPAMNLALVLGARRILLIGVDMTQVDRNAREWERSPKPYYRKFARIGFSRVAKVLGKSNLISLFPKTPVKEVTRVKDEKHALAVLAEAAAEAA